MPPKETKNCCGKCMNWAPHPSGSYYTDDGGFYYCPCHQKPAEECICLEDNKLTQALCKIHNHIPTDKKECWNNCPKYSVNSSYGGCSCIRGYHVNDQKCMCTCDVSWNKKFPTDEIVGWEKEFNDADFGIEYLGIKSKEMLKNFIRQTLQKEYHRGLKENVDTAIKYYVKQSQQSLLEKIERELPKEKEIYASDIDSVGRSNIKHKNGYNQALSEVKEILRKLK